MFVDRFAIRANFQLSVGSVELSHSSSDESLLGTIILVIQVGLSIKRLAVSIIGLVWSVFG